MQYFNISEFDSPDKEGSGESMEPSFLAMLEGARGVAEGLDPSVFFRVTSGFRTLGYNKEIGGVDGSSHVKGMAADIDISWMDDKQFAATMVALGIAGFRRVGLKRGKFVHVDNDPNKPVVTWGYGMDEEHKA